MNRRDAEAQRINQLTELVIGFCIEIHKTLGPGLLESAYEECLCYELINNKTSFERQKDLPVSYKDIHLEKGFRLDVVVEGILLVELKSTATLLPVHEAQVLTYLRLTGISAGLLINFNSPTLISGLKRLVNNFPDVS